MLKFLSMNEFEEKQLGLASVFLSFGTKFATTSVKSKATLVVLHPKS